MPTLTLKTYQDKALEALELFLRQATDMGAPAAWAHAMQRQEMSAVLYRSDELGDVPAVCLRIPTGGGKTLLAAHAIARIGRHWAQREHPTALWLVPSETIRSQTLTALQTPGHAYRAALQDAYGDALVVCELDALHMVPPRDFGTKAVVVVATIQSFRVANKAGRRVYAMSEAWETHFQALNLTPQDALQAGLSCVDAADLANPEQTFLTHADLGRVKTSLANWLAWQQPIVIVDEAHNAKTPLSLSMLKSIRPSCVLDLTATPVPAKTNVLYAVSARELEAEAMIKLPILLAEHTGGWQDAVRDALLRRTQLEAEAAHEAEYVRPIALFQAQDKGGAVTVDVLLQHLTAQSGIAREEIAVATGSMRELDGIDLFDPRCRIRYIVTVDALREGWDCSFAYVLCSLQNLRSNTAVEQLLGRVLRMPYAKRRSSPALNRAYAHVVARSFWDAADALVGSLVEGMGFDRFSAATAVLPDTGDSDLFGHPGAASAPHRPTLELALPVGDAAQLAVALRTLPDVRVIAPEQAGGSIFLQIEGPVTDTLRSLVEAAVPKPERARIADAFDQHAAREQALRAPAERGDAFQPIPRLCIRVQGELELIERETLADLIEFDLLRADPRPQLDGFALVEQSNQIEIFVEGERVRTRRTTDPLQFSLDGVVAAADDERVLVNTLALDIRREGLTQLAAQAWAQRLVSHLLHERGLPLAGCWRARFQLGRAAVQRIDGLFAEARSNGFQALLWGRLPGVALAADPRWAFRFEPGRYPARDPYSGRHQFQKHYYRDIAKLKAIGEEFDCAKALDSEAAVKHWVRNLERLPEFAFWLPTATDYFYPDFVAELQDGRLFVVEYKGEGYATNDDSREKRLIGQRWAAQTGQCFSMVEKNIEGLDMAAQIRRAVAVV